jgi:hypothetical protein
MTDRASAGGVSLLVTTGELAIFGARAAREIFVPPFEIRETARQLNITESTVKQDQRLSFAVNLIIHFQAVYRNIAAFRLGLNGRICCYEEQEYRNICKQLYAANQSMCSFHDILISCWFLHSGGAFRQVVAVRVLDGTYTCRMGSEEVVVPRGGSHCLRRRHPPPDPAMPAVLTRLLSGYRHAWP